MEQAEPQAQPETRQDAPKKRTATRSRREIPSLDIEVAKLQVHNDYILEAISGLNAKMDRVETNLNDRMDRLENSMDTRFNFLIGTMFGGFAAMLGVLAKGFNWL